MINVERIRKQVRKAIDALPTEIRLKRKEKIDDGYGGYIQQEVDVKTFNAFINFDSPSIVISNNDSGNITKLKSITLLAVYDATFEIRKDDYFISNGIKYRVKYPLNPYDIYWECELEVVE